MGAELGARGHHSCDARAQLPWGMWIGRGRDGNAPPLAGGVLTLDRQGSPAAADIS